VSDIAMKSLKNWLAIPGNRMSRIADLLGYKSSVVIDQWIRRNHIPDFRVEQVMEILKNDKSVKSSKKG
jgi:hypothetical protein